MSTSARQATPLGTKNENPRGIGLLDLLWEDFRTHDRDPFEAGFWAVALHRVGNWRMGIRSNLIRKPVSAAYQAANLAVRYGFGIKLDYTVRLGRRVRIWHHGGMVLGAQAIGNDVHIRLNTTFGVKYRNSVEKPVIGDGVDVASGVAILGGVRVGEGCIIGANAVVTKDIPPNSVVVGVPGRVVKSLEEPIPLSNRPPPLPDPSSISN